MPEGYKQTEVGVIPEDWGLVALSTLIDENRHIRYGIVQPGRRNPNGCLMLRSQDYSKGWRGTDGMHRIEKSLEKQFDGARIKAGDLVITLVGAGVAQIVEVPDWIEGTILSRSTGRIAVDTTKAFNKYVLHFMSSALGRGQVLFNIKEGAQPVVSSLDVGACLIPYPDLQEQTAIANALSDVDNLIASLETLITKKSAIKTAAMQQLLTGKKRLPGFGMEGANQGEKIGEKGSAQLDEKQREEQDAKQASDQPAGSGSMAETSQIKSAHINGSQINDTPIQSGAHPTPRPGYKQTELGEIPEDWEVKSLGAALSIMHGKDQKQVECSDGSYPILGTGGEMGSTDSYLYDKPSVLIGRKGSINKPRYMDSPFWTVDTLFYSQVNNNFNAKFIYYKFCMIDWMSYNEASGVPSLNSSTIESVVQIFPQTKKEQTAIANVLSDMDTELDALQQRLEKTQSIKQGMMQELLTGKTRLIKPLEEVVHE